MDLIHTHSSAGELEELPSVSNLDGDELIDVNPAPDVVAFFPPILIFS